MKIKSFLPSRPGCPALDYSVRRDYLTSPLLLPPLTNWPSHSLTSTQDTRHFLSWTSNFLPLFFLSSIPTYVSPRTITKSHYNKQSLQPSSGTSLGLICEQRSEHVGCWCEDSPYGWVQIIAKRKMVEYWGRICYQRSLALLTTLQLNEGALFKWIVGLIVVNPESAWDGAYFKVW